MSRWLLVVLAVLCSTILAGAQSSTAAKPPASASQSGDTGSTDPQKAADIRRLMEVTGAGGLAMQLMRAFETDLRPVIENSLPPGDYRSKLVELYLAKFRSKANDESFVNLVIPIYEKYFSDDEIKQLTAFYETPVGKKAVAELPKVVAESQQAGKQWGENLGQASMDEVLAEHPDLKKALEDAQKENTYPWVKQ